MSVWAGSWAAAARSTSRSVSGSHKSRASRAHAAMDDVAQSCGDPMDRVRGSAPTVALAAAGVAAGVAGASARDESDMTDKAPGIEGRRTLHIVACRHRRLGRGVFCGPFGDYALNATFCLPVRISTRCRWFPTRPCRTGSGYRRWTMPACEYAGERQAGPAIFMGWPVGILARQRPYISARNERVSDRSDRFPAFVRR